MSCRKFCSICEGTFVPERGCILEKRCPACRLLYGNGKPGMKEEVAMHATSINTIKVYLHPQDRDNINEKIVSIEVAFSEPEPHSDMMEIAEGDEFVDNFWIRAKDILTANEYKAATLYIKEEYGLSEIAGLMDVSPERARQLVGQVSKKFRLSRRTWINK